MKDETYQNNKIQRPKNGKNGRFRTSKLLLTFFKKNRFHVKSK